MAHRAFIPQPNKQAWWAIVILAFNLNSAMKHLVLGGNWATKRMKAIRFALINLPGRIIKRSRELIIRLTGGHASNELLLMIRRRILSRKIHEFSG